MRHDTRHTKNARQMPDVLKTVEKSVKTARKMQALTLSLVLTVEPSTDTG